MSNLDPTILNPNARPVGTGVERTNVTIKPENKKMANQIGNGNTSRGIDRAIEATQAIPNVKAALKKIPSDQLKTIGLAQELLTQMPHQILCSDRMDQKAIDTDTLRWLIQRELDSRKEGELPYSFGELYLLLGIPKHFLRD